MESVSGGCLPLTQTEQHRAVHSFSGIPPSTSLVQNKFPQLEAINHFHKTVLVQSAVQEHDTSLSPLLAGFEGRSIEKEGLLRRSSLPTEHGC